MALVVKAAIAMHWFGVQYAAGDVIDTTGYDDRAMTQLLTTQPVYVSDPSGGSSAGVLTWDAGTSDYLPTAEKAASTPKVFVGPTDPHTVVGVVVNAYDQWVQTGF